MKTYHLPRRWVFYLIYGVMVVLLLAQAPLHVGVHWHQVLEAIIVGASLGAMAWWKRHIAGALKEDALQRIVLKRARQRHVCLTAVQLDYLVAQERRVQEYGYGN